MRVLLQPGSGDQRVALRRIYEKAVTEATELVVLSAYLTEWPIARRLSPHCNEVTFLVGTDFGLTRKDACRSVLAWLPKVHKHGFLAADEVSGFHPKLLMWSDRQGHHHLVVGSSNLTDAAFSDNHEANVYLRIAKAQYDQIRRWVMALREKGSPISEDWLARYREMPLSGRGRGHAGKVVRPAPVVPVRLPKGQYLDEAIRGRRLNQAKVARPLKRMARLIRQCASGKIDKAAFYKAALDWWSDNSVQGGGWSRTCKYALWDQTCRGLAPLLSKSADGSKSDLDNSVRLLIDDLAMSGNPTRKAWLTELLCRYFPDRYPILNSPVVAWLRHIQYRGPRGASEGSKYIDLSLKLRQAVKHNEYNSANNLMELDGAIWQWYARNF